MAFHIKEDLFGTVHRKDSSVIKRLVTYIEVLADF
jgi:hypothetical protein